MEDDKIYTAHHGGDVLAIAAEFGIEAEKLIDFSANINPLGPPAGVLQRLQKDAADIELLKRYPEANFTSLKRKLAARNRVAENQIVITNGASALIEIVVRAASRRKQNPCCLLPVPAFSEYERALLAADFRVINFKLEKDRKFRLDEKRFVENLKNEKPELVIINNPHNPTGALIKSAMLRRIVKEAEKTGTIVLLDEAFIDYAPQESLTRATADYKNLVVLRSLTKFYAMPALRVGYAVASNALAEIFTGQIPSWSVTTLAANAAAEAVGDAKYAERTLIANAVERKFLAAALQKIGLNVYPSAANFLFIELPPNASAAELRSELIKNNRLIVRNCSSYSGIEPEKFVRIAVRRRSENERLVAALSYFLKN